MFCNPYESLDNAVRRMKGTTRGRVHPQRMIIPIVKRELKIDLAMFDQGVSSSYRRL